MKLTRKIAGAAGQAFHLLYGSDIYEKDFNECVSTYDRVITRKLPGEFTEAAIEDLKPACAAWTWDAARDTRPA